jgi:hypothetical protein
MREELRPIGSGLERLLRDMGMPEEFDVAALADDWAEVAGEPFAELSHPVSFGSGELVIEVSDGTAASLLKYHTGDLVERLGARFGRGAVSTVRIRVGRGKKGP